MAKVMLMILITTLILGPIAYAVDLDTNCKLRVMLLGASGRLEQKHDSVPERKDTSWTYVYNKAHGILKAGYGYGKAVSYLRDELTKAGYYYDDFMFQQGMTKNVYLLIQYFLYSQKYGDVISEGKWFLDKERGLKEYKRRMRDKVFVQQDEITISIFMMEAYINLDEVDEAVKLGEKILQLVDDAEKHNDIDKIDPLKADAQIMCARAYFIVEEYDKVIELLEKALEIMPKGKSQYHGKDNDEAYARDMLIKAYLGSGNVDKAVKKAEDAAKQFEDSDVIRNSLAKAYLMLGDKMFILREEKEAVKNYKKTMLISNNRDEDLYSLALSKLDILGVQARTYSDRVNLKATINNHRTKKKYLLTESSFLHIVRSHSSSYNMRDANENINLFPARLKPGHIEELVCKTVFNGILNSEIAEELPGDFIIWDVDDDTKKKTGVSCMAVICDSKNYIRTAYPVKGEEVIFHRGGRKIAKSKIPFSFWSRFL